VGILALLVSRVGGDAFTDGLRVINPATLLVAVGIGALTTVFSAWRWCLTARGLGIRLPLRTAVGDYYQSLFLNATLPGGLLGDVHRAVRNGKDSGDVGRGVRAVVLERTAGQITLFTVGFVVLLAHPALLMSTAAAVAVPPPVVAGAAVIGLGVVALAVRKARRRTSRTGRALRTAVGDVRRGLLARRNWPGIAIASAIVLAGHLGTFLLAARAAGSSAPALRLLPFAVLALVAMTLPLSVGGWGPREGVCAWAFSAAGLGAAEGLTTAVVYGLLAMAASLPGVVVVLVRLLARQRTAAVQAAAVRDEPRPQVETLPPVCTRSLAMASA
jgi:uncharacterized membrane protein YbhN (UPF0104 family)